MTNELPKCTQKMPYVKGEQPGTYAWCSCGTSKTQPFCDGSHKGTGFAPMRTELKEAKTVAWCGCRKSGNKPFCDGSHSKM